ncbi:hypothetical protein [Leifsonia sp. NPDC058230]|uniref:hypothetical protein n=1 Tax=Leifsonia sp. NPDC058230 TaxID=3346391 RepID=UPI0036D76533
MAVVGAAVTLLAVSGCSAGGGAPAAQPPSVSATPTPSATPSGVDCSALLSDDDVSALLGSTVGTVDPNLAAATGKSVGWLAGYAIEAVQGANCVWGEPGTEWTWHYGSQQEPVFALHALPHAQAAWAELRPEGGAPGAAYVGGESFGGSCADGTCHTDVLAGNWWLSADASSAKGVMTERAFHDQVQKAVTALLALPEPAAVSVHNAIVDACVSDEYAAAVTQSFDVPQASFMGREYQFGMASAVWYATVTGGCAFQPSLDGSGGFLMSAWVVPDAKRTFGEFARLAGQKPTVTEFNRVTGNDNSDNLSNEFYALVGNDWVTIFSYPSPDAERQSREFVEWLRATYA